MAQNDKKTWLFKNTKINELLGALRQHNLLLDIRVASYSPYDYQWGLSICFAKGYVASYAADVIRRLVRVLRR